MINVQKTIDKDFEHVREALIYHLNRCIIDGNSTLIFNVKQHSTLRHKKVRRTMRRQLRRDVRQLEQVKRVQVKQLQKYFSCTCHSNCLSINRYFKKTKLQCGTYCYLTLGKWYIGSNFESCTYKSSTCRRMAARGKYEACDKTLLLIITLNHHEICPVIHLKTTKPQKYTNCISSDDNN